MMIDKKNKNNNEGFVILFTVTLSAVLLAVALGVASVALKEVQFSTSARAANDAFFAADSGIEYALLQDKPNPASAYILGPEESEHTWNNLPPITGLGSDGKSCARITVRKERYSPPFVSTTITSKGYNLGGDSFCTSNSPNLTERELEVSYGASPSGFWTNTVGVDASGSNLTKTAATAWGNAGAISVASVASGDVYMQFSTNENNTGKMLGLSNGDSSQNFNDIDFAIYPRFGTELQIYEKGTHKGNFGNYVAGDVFTVAIISGEVKYYKNETFLYTSLTAPTYPISIDSALRDIGTTVINAILVPGTYTP